MSARTLTIACARKLTIACVLACALPSLARADAATDALFEKGNRAYLHGDYKGAIDAYEQLVATGIVHEDLHFNLANAYVKADRLGPAILHYEQALQLDPSQEDAAANLKLARQTAAGRWQDRIEGAERDPFWMRALEQFSPGGLTLLFLGVYVAMFALALAAYLLPSGFTRVAVLALLVFAFAGTVGSGALLAGRWWLANKVEQAIVLPDEVAIKEGPDANYQTSFLIHGGMKVRIVEHDQDWLKVRLTNGLEGWTRDRDVGRL
jgi:tetratricopeptide (TPR) repeat protein